MQNDLDCVEYLVEQGADIHAKDKNCVTVLMWSTNEEASEYLRKKGAK